MDRRMFLTTMLQGSLATALLPDSITSLLITPYAFPYDVTGSYQPNMKILAIGIDAFGAYAARLLAYSTQHVCCCELTPHAQLHQGHVLRGLDTAIQQSNLLFLLADVTQPSSASALAACLEAAEGVGIQATVITPDTASYQHPYPFVGSVVSYCSVPDPMAARNLVSMVADLANIDGIDYDYVKPVLQSGRSRHFASYQAAGAERGAVAGQGVLAKLQQQIQDDQVCSGAMACIYCDANTYQRDFDQAITELFCFFLPNSTNKFNILYNCVIDEKLVDEVRVVVLAIT